jgi:hypothetical protein
MSAHTPAVHREPNVSLYTCCTLGAKCQPVHRGHMSSYPTHLLYIGSTCQPTHLLYTWNKCQPKHLLYTGSQMSACTSAVHREPNFSLCTCRTLGVKCQPVHLLYTGATCHPILHTCCIQGSHVSLYTCCTLGAKCQPTHLLDTGITCQPVHLLYTGSSFN